MHHRRRPVLRTALLLALTCVHAVAAPTGGVVISGIGGIATSGTTTTVTQGSDRLSLNWATFNVGAAETVRFNQPSASSLAVNRIADVNGSRIQGSLQANGQVFLINPNGIIFSSTAQVNVGGLVASTLDISDADLANGMHRFSGSGTGAVSNAGTITANGGYIALLGGTVTNTGTLTAHGGTVALGAGNRVALDFAGDRLVSLAVEENTVLSEAANGGLIRADGGQVLLSAGARNSLVASVVNNTGVIEARSVENRDGRIILLGGMAAGTTNVAGKLDASAPNGGNGGFIETSAATVKVASSAAITTKATSASGKTGTWLIDPTDFTIAAAGGDITGAALATQLVDNNVVIESVAGATDGNGDIFVNDTVSWSANQLTLSAERNIAINANLTASDTASLALLYGQGGVAEGNPADYTIAAGKTISLPSGGSFSTKLGSDGALNTYTVVNTVEDLQNVSSTPFVALGADIDASATATWNYNDNGGDEFYAGFVPLTVNGTFAGLGHTITDLVVNRRSTDYVGLIGYAPNATIRDIGLVGGSITGSSYVGGLVGYIHNGTISNAYANGAVSGEISVGGLIGYSNYATISHASASGAVSGATGVGGLVGRNYYGMIGDSHAKGAVFGSNYGAGGLVGYNDHGTISNSYATGDVLGFNNVGGFVGYNDHGIISNAYTTGNVQGYYYVGGVVGNNFAGALSGVASAGNVQGSNFVGGVAGQNQSVSAFAENYYIENDIEYYSSTYLSTDLASITGAVNTGSVTGLYSVGGVVGSDSGGVITGSVNTGAVLAEVSVGGLVGVTQVVDAQDFAYAYDYTNDEYLYETNEFAFRATTYIAESRNEGRVSGTGNVGGLIGLTNYSTINNAYAVGDVSGTVNVGGLVGYSYGGTISNAYATGPVSGSFAFGGLIGRRFETVMNNAGWDSYSTGAASAVGDGLLSGAFEVTSDPDQSAASNYAFNQSAYAGFDFGGTWFMIEGSTRPFLRSEYSTTITNANQLQLMLFDLGATYTLAADIDASATSGANASGMWGAAGFKPIGDVFGTYFSGNFYGDGHIITGLNIDRPSENSIGLFGAITGSIVRDVGFEGGSVSGRDYVGGIIGYSDNSTITNVFNNRDVTSNWNSVGGLVGLLAYSTLSSAYNSGDISITSIYGAAGGLAGGVTDSTITNAYNTGAVSGTVLNYVGGLAGTSFRGDITHAYSTGSVTAISPEAIGGLIGYNYDSTLASSVYWNTETSTRANAIGANASGHAGVNDSTGLTTAQLQDPTFLATSGWDQSVWAPSSAGYNPELYALSAIVSVDGGSVVYGEAVTTIGNITQGGPGSYVFGASGGNNIAGDTVLAIDGVNYRITGEFTVIARAITLTADNQTRVYGDANPEFTYSITEGSLVNGDLFTGTLASDADGFSGVGSYTIGVGTLGNARYTITFVEGSLEITQRAVTVTADATSRTYGDENSGFGYTVTEGTMVNDDTFAGELGTTAGLTSNVGFYEVTQGTLDNANYAITFVGAELEVTQRTAYVEANSGTRAYGDANPELNYEYYNVVNDDLFTGALSTIATVTSNVGTYEITQGDLALNSNYVIEFYSNELEVTQRAVTVTADNKVKTIGAANPALTYSVTTGSVVNNDAFTGALATNAVTESAIGDYGITQGDLAFNSNYALTFIDGVLTVTDVPAEPVAEPAADADVKRAAQQAQSSDGFTGPRVNPVTWGTPAPLELDFEALPLPAGLTTASN